MTPNDFRKMALSLPNAVEGAHMNHPDFRVNGRIFATLHPDGRQGMVKLSPHEQQAFMRASPTTFVPASGAWGRQGCTMVRLDAVDEEALGEAMTLAWQEQSKSKSKVESRKSKVESRESKVKS